MGLFSFVGGLFGGGSQKKASQKAMQAQVDALNRGIDVQNAQFQQSRADFMPYQQAGTGALEQLTGLINPADPAALTSQLQASPLYGALYRGGEEALLQNASATGGLRGGDTARGLADFGSDTLARVYDDMFAKLSGVAGMGLGATGNVAGLGAQNAGAVSGLLGGIGDARAANYLTKGGINARNWQNAGSFLDSAVAAGMGGGGGGGGFSFANALKGIF